MTKQEMQKLAKKCIANPIWAARRIVELQEEITSLQEQIGELEESLSWSEEHGSRCRCIECAVPGAYDDDDDEE